MQKLTIFFIGAVVVVVVITGTLLGYRFATRDKGEEQTEPTKIVKEIPEEIPKEIEETRVDPDKPKETDTAVLIDTEPETPAEEPSEPIDPYALASIRTRDIATIGFDNAGLNFAPFDGFVFDTIDISEYNDNDHIAYELMSDGESQGKINELIFPTEEITNEIYSILLQKITDDEKFTVNETNQYGDASFFANHSEDNNSVFLVVKIGLRMYTLHYPAKNHNKIKNLINLLHG